MSQVVELSFKCNVTCLHSCNNMLFVSEGVAKKVTVWDSSGQCLQTIQMKNSVQSMAVFNNHLIVGYHDRLSAVFDVSSCQPLPEQPNVFTRCNQNLCVSNGLLIGADWTAGTEIWDSSYNCIAKLNECAELHFICAWQDKLFSAHFDPPVIQVWSIAQQKQVATITTSCRSLILADSYLLVGGLHGDIKVYDCRTHQQLFLLQTSVKESIRSLLACKAVHNDVSLADDWYLYASTGMGTVLAISWKEKKERAIWNTNLPISRLYQVEDNIVAWFMSSKEVQLWKAFKAKVSSRI